MITSLSPTENAAGKEASTDMFTIRKGDMQNLLERNHVLAAWLRTMAGYGDRKLRGSRDARRDSEPERDSEAAYFVTAVGRDNFYEGHDRLLRERLIPNSKVLVACLPEDPDAIVGWVCYGGDGRLVHYVFVKPKWRRLGIAKLLVDAVGREIGAGVDMAHEPVVYTHRSRLAQSLPIPSGWRFDPYPALEAGCSRSR